MEKVFLESPIGWLEIVSENEKITQISFADKPEGKETVTPLLTEAKRQLQSYFDGTLSQFDLPLVTKGTPFRQKVWETLQDIHFGEVASYKDIAKAVGNAKAVRAVGGANHHNPISIIIPCHRVVGADGSLTGYAGGMERKQWLLNHEKRLAG